MLCVTDAFGSFYSAVHGQLLQVIRTLWNSCIFLRFREMTGSEILQGRRLRPILKCVKHAIHNAQNTHPAYMSYGNNGEVLRDLCV